MVEQKFVGVMKWYMRDTHVRYGVSVLRQSQLVAWNTVSHGEHSSVAGCPTGTRFHTGPLVEYIGWETEVLSGVLKITQCGLFEWRSSYESTWQGCLRHPSSQSVCLSHSLSLSLSHTHTHTQTHTLTQALTPFDRNEDVYIFITKC